MPSKREAILRGKAFEWFIKKLLLRCGFSLVKADGELVYAAGAGLMVHGLGQPHNTDVLLSPPFQIPFYFPSRLIVECKCYSTPLGLPFAREVLGLRQDINSFEIITPNILNARRKYRKITPLLKHRRYLYQVALASASGFKSTAEQFAAAHRIPLISTCALPAYKFLSDFIAEFSNTIPRMSRDNYDSLLQFFRGTNDTYDGEVGIVKEFAQKCKELFPHFFVGVLESGDIILLYSTTQNALQEISHNVEVKIHWKGGDERYWEIAPINSDLKFIFELPETIYNEWASKGFDKRYAIGQKEDIFRSIIVFDSSGGEVRVVSFKISPEFIQQTRKNLATDSDGSTHC